MNIKSGAVSLHVRPAKEVKTALIAVSCKGDGCPCLIRALECGSAPAGGSRFDNTAVLYAMYMHARSRVHKSAAEETKARVSKMGCAIQDGHFVIFAECEGSVTTVRKTLGAILQGLNPAKVRPDYITAIRALGLAPNGEAFEAAAHSAMAGLKDIDVFVGGKAFGSASGDKAKVQDALDKATKKLNPEAPKGRGAKRADPSGDCTKMFRSKAGSPAAAVLAWAVSVNDHPGLCVSDGKLCASESQETKLSKLADRKEALQREVEKLLKLDAPGASLAAIAARHGLLSSDDLVKLSDSSFTAAGLATEVTKMF